MNAALALSYIQNRMEELGHKNYIIRTRHLVLQGLSERKIEGNNHVFVLVEPYSDVRIESTAGVFDKSEHVAPELQYEHRGDITIKNPSMFICHACFIQAIPTIN